ncbi:hypothetical protein PL78_12115 [Yersinia entomophaga]|uniref:Uncharacterized protein n=1 Tax=Yersinia entomophaga TaxID=935293 RepID=A0ABM6BMA3_YERET|nr:hypothetical protein [Yersinia entomophaga]ANI30567.1 hypothetical protein PL78_12115 [Yersinia entomophaga]OWF86814.1 hypothetical protein B4914_13890 [Yersinia entomophaga]
MPNMIGTKSTVGIEYDISDSKLFMGYARLWFEGNSLGALSELIYLDGYLVGGLMDIMKKERLQPILGGESQEAIFCKLNEALCISDDDFYDDEKNDLSDLARSYSVSFGTFLDDFTVFSFRDESGEGNILWQISSPVENVAHAELKNYPRRIFYSKFIYDDIELLINRIESLKAGA